MEYNYLVRIKTSITLPKELLDSVDREDSNRSAFIERATQAYLGHLAKTRREAQDVRIINRHAQRLNREAKDVLQYQELP